MAALTVVPQLPHSLQVCDKHEVGWQSADEPCWVCEPDPDPPREVRP